VVQEQDATDHCGQGHQDRNIYELPAAASPVTAMPKVVVNWPGVVRMVLIWLADLPSTRIEVCHGDYPHKSPDLPVSLQRTPKEGTPTKSGVTSIVQIGGCLDHCAK
jgi:hypothetical protein